MCERDLVKWLVGHIAGRVKRVKVNGKWKKLYFYDYAIPPPDREEP